MRSSHLLVIALSLMQPAPAGAQREALGQGTRSPAALADSVLAAFSRRDTTAFDRLFPFPEGRALLRSAVAEGVPTVAVSAEVLRADRRSALLLLAGYLAYGNSGDETSSARPFSGLYLARPDSSGEWLLDAAPPLEKQGTIKSHRLRVELEPGAGLEVTDSLGVAVVGGYGLGLRLNHRADIHSVTFAGRAIPWHFGGGVLWLSAPTTKGADLVIAYRVDVATDSLADPNSGRFMPEFGHVRNQYFWHPFIWFDDGASFQLRVSAPASVIVATDLDQRDSVAGGRRIVTAATSSPVAALSLFYDAGWVPVERQAGGFRFKVFATPDFSPSPDSLARSFDRVVKLLSARFGPPGDGYRAIVQQRARPRGSAGWPFMSNQVIAANWNGGPVIADRPVPRAYYGHEIAHAWTHPSGPARNFLSEGWATWAESLVLREAFGEAAVAAFWESERQRYIGAGYEGRARLADDPSNSGVSYSKGAWVFHMLEEELGSDAFDAALRCYMSLPRKKPAGLPEFIACVRRFGGRQPAIWLSSWVISTETPRISAAIESDQLVVRETGDSFFPLRVEVGIVAGIDTMVVTVPLSSRELRVPLPPSIPRGATAVVDPGRRLLLVERQGQP